MKCEACEGGRCYDCGMQTWCECDCAGPDADYAFDPEYEANLTPEQRDERNRYTDQLFCQNAKDDKEQSDD